MKKVLSFAMAMAMVLSLSVSALAAEVQNGVATSDVNNSQATIQVTGKYNAGSVSDTGEVYSVKISWSGTTELTYSAAKTVYYWDPADTTYKVKADSSTDAGWTAATEKLTVAVENRSNREIWTKAVLASTATGVTLTWTDDSDQAVAGIQRIDSADKDTDISANKLVGAAVTATFSGKVAAEGAIAAEGPLGTVTVTLSTTAITA